jgi:hypothetical protein
MLEKWMRDSLKISTATSHAVSVHVGEMDARLHENLDEPPVVWAPFQTSTEKWMRDSMKLSTTSHDVDST